MNIVLFGITLVVFVAELDELLFEKSYTFNKSTLKYHMFWEFWVKKKY